MFRFIRAHALYNIVEQWGGKYLPLEPMNSPISVLPCSSVNDFYKVILEDLEFAMKNLPITQEVKGHVTRAAAYHLYAKACLTFSTYTDGLGNTTALTDSESKTYLEKAKAAADYLIQNAGSLGVKLYDDVEAVFDENNNKNNEEALFIVCELYSEEMGLRFNRRQVLEGYMIMGGVPFYWSQLKPGMSLAQNINQLFFSEDGNLRHEFDDLYDSLFKQPKPYLSIVDALATKKVGMTRTEILQATKLTDNGKLTEYLENLEYCGFIRKYNCIGMKAKNALFQLMDNYTLFYYKFIKDSYINDAQYWTKITGKPEYNTWCGLAFERVCLQHVEQIKTKLGIQGVITTVYSWSVAGSKDKPGAQIDLLIDRSDDVINLCEIKYSKAPFQITNTIDASLQNKRERFIQETGTEKAVHLTMITTMGLSDNPYAWDVQSVVTMDDLFVL